MRARWRTTLDASKAEAVLAVDLYNQSNRSRRLEGFFVHIHMAWLYLFEAQYQRDHLDYYYRLSNGRYERVDGEPKTWDLTRFVRAQLTDGESVRKNLELTISLRNKIEHRFEEATTVATAGYAQSLLLNFEERVTAVFGQEQSLGSELRFPIFVGTLTREGSIRLADAQRQLPKKTRKFLTDFEAGMNPSVIQDHRYEFRVRLIPKIGSKTEADLALSFVRQDELSDDERLALEELGRAGTVIVRDQTRAVASDDLMKPTPVAAEIEARIPFEFKIQHVNGEPQSVVLEHCLRKEMLLLPDNHGDEEREHD
ncbi:MAG TPA: DUF3644 domain-containing protein [Candidatus Saccharimonadales bacterium]|nr:DUF3644 domain-containing protein [Candidatus Saccharimonadales bacterium]